MPSRVTRSRSQRDLREAEEVDKATPNDRKRIASETTESSSRGSKRIKRTEDEQYNSRVSNELEIESASPTRVRNGSKGNPAREATATGARIKRTVEEEAEEEEQEEEEQDAEGTVIRTKRTRKKKVKKEEVVEMKPLAARTTGLRMFIGAHVSAAKGVYCIPSASRDGIWLSRLNACCEIGIHNAISNSTHIGYGKSCLHTSRKEVHMANSRGCSGNAFALFLKSQRKWDNPPLETEHRDLFRKYCADHSYDASK
jgi:AP endonuclease-1